MNDFLDIVDLIFSVGSTIWNYCMTNWLLAFSFMLGLMFVVVRIVLILRGSE